MATPKKMKVLHVDFVLQMNGEDYTVQRLEQSAKDVWVYDMHRDIKDLKDLILYAKPDERTVYVIANGEEAYSFAI